ncbi:MAG TPA: hypothetical protein VJ872_02175 [Nocardioides sp.]|nr:hypothetical protein [Nocardioides sp.]
MSSQQEMPAEGPDDPAYTGEDEERDDSSEGQVSEVSRMDPAEADTPIPPSDATAGSGDPDAQEGEAGPNAKPTYNKETNEFSKD